jgi:hypothetical protein
MNQDPSVLDFIKAHIRVWRHKILHPSADAQATEEIEYWTEKADDQPVQTSIEKKPSLYFPWRVLLALGLGLMGQLSLEPHPGVERTWQTGVVLYVLACWILLWTNLRGEIALPVWGVNLIESSKDVKFLRSSFTFIISLVFALGAFIFFGDGRFTFFNVTIWCAAILTMVLAFWQPRPNHSNWLGDVKGFISRSQWKISLDRWTLLVLVVTGLALFFRVYRLSDVPSQMISDHAEKLWDVSDVLNGQTSVFFIRNTGREFFQFYLTAAIILLFKTGLTFLSLKVGTVLAGLGGLYYMYRLGRDFVNPRAGLFVLAFAGIAFWPNVLARYGLRFPLYPLFYAPALYYLVQGLTTRNRNSFLISGLFLGLGLHGYSPYRVVPFVLLLAVGLYVLHEQSKGFRLQTGWGLFAIVVISFIVFLPLLRYMIENPDIVLFRAMTRVSGLERPLPDELWRVFLQNIRNSLTMFAWDDGEIWPISVPHRPVLDVVTSAFFHLGVLLVIIRYVQQRHWFDIFTLISIPVLMMPSILSLAFPGENPSLNRSGAAMIPVFLIVGMSADAFMTALESVSTWVWNKRFAWAIGAFLVILAAFQNYDVLFNQYRKLYDSSAWNTSEMGEVIHDFAQLTGNSENAWLVGYPHWVDSRLVMINAGFPTRDNAIWPENFESTLADPRAKLFLININDSANLALLQSLYPEGSLTEYQSKYENRNFFLFVVPPR